MLLLPTGLDDHERTIGYLRAVSGKMIVPRETPGIKPLHPDPILSQGLPLVQHRMVIMRRLTRDDDN